ncbi:acetyltransferase (GNAT) family domain-containing protein [Trichoderma breve]|uniref:Acetyltransferase (GNAT) family domain-containing protein n=1 Tax=Trichoderma breve TaxID=2034170 RepID=A0A9W9B5F4_9HYPO|nr:acetyltransferase (GNAT) family domain-containing protein [Trichoderma breve]KAJ4854844.1 acetyltransferase (GNAT) family domain-containing protein [Trichoderma breve]
MSSLPRPVTTLFVSEKLVYRSVQIEDKDTFYAIISEPGCMELEEYRGKGYGAEATKWAVDWAFNYTGVHRIELWSFSYNETAIRLWEKIGFKLEGRKRESVWFQRKWFDTVLYSILEHEWEGK